MGFFRVKSKTKIADLNLGDVVQESDFCCIEDGQIVQLEHVDEDEKARPYIVKPGIWSITRSGMEMVLEPTSYANDEILPDLMNTKQITDKIDCFFRNLHMYAKFGIEIPRRAALLYGPAGTGKTSTLIHVANKYANDGETAVLNWSTDKFEAHQIKDFIKRFEYKDVKKLILVAEDIGGVEIDQQRRPSDSSLLSLLDNKEKIFKLPIFTIATTNFPENFLGNLTNRPGRFDDKIEVGYPDGSARARLLQFFLKGSGSEQVLAKLAEKRYGKFSAAHVQEVVIRSAIYEVSLEESIDLVAGEISHYEKLFSGKPKLGIGMGADYD